MVIRCIWEHNGNDTLLYAENLVGAFSRGPNPEIALAKMQQEAVDYLTWCGEAVPDQLHIQIVQEKASDLRIADADSDVLFEQEKQPLTKEEYDALKGLALRSATDFLRLYQSIPQTDISPLPFRKTFYGDVPRTAREMYQHTKNVNSYYFAEIGIGADNEGSIADCRRRGFTLLEQTPDFLTNPVFEGSYGEDWTLRKVLRRFLWHDRIHAKAMYRMAVRQFGAAQIPNIFSFGHQKTGEF